MADQDRHQQGMAKLREIAGDRASSPLGDWTGIAPDMRRYIVEFIAGDVLSRPGLEAKTRQLATVSMLCALGHAPDEFKMHLGGALRLGWTREQLVEVLLQAAVFAGFPSSLNALKWAAEVFSQDIAVNPAQESVGRSLIGKAQAADTSLDADAFVALLTSDVVFRMGGQPEILGRDAVRAAVADLFTQMQRIEHRTIQIWEDGGQLALRAEVTMERKDGRVVVLPYVNTLTVAAEGLFSAYRIHIDAGPLFRA